MIHKTVLSSLICLMILIGLWGSLIARQTVGGTDIELYTLTGDISFQSHAYTTTQGFDRREPFGALTSANLSYSFLGFNSGMDLRYTTDDNKFRQTMNRISFFGSWRWMRLSAGDVSPSYSQYSLRGTMVRGGELSLTPGNFLLEVAAGRVNRLTSGGSGNPQGPRSFEYERWLYAATVGYGRRNSSNFSITALYGKDDTQSLPDTTGLNLPATRPLAPPAENLAVTPKFQIVLFDNSFRLGAETSVSAFSRDMNSPVLPAEEAGVPSFLTNIFSPRNSTRLSFAGMAETEVDIDPFGLLVSYERIQPGFESMGLRQIRDDQQIITVRPSVHFLQRRGAIDLTYTMTKDNLLGHRISTQKGGNIAVNSNFQITEVLRLGAGYSRFVSSTTEEMENAVNGHRQLSQVFQFMPSAAWISGAASHNLSLAAVYQTLESRFPSADDSMTNESSTITASLNYSAALPAGLSINGTGSVVLGETTGSEFTTMALNGGAGYAFLNQKLNVSANAGVSMNEFRRINGVHDLVNQNMQMNGNITASYSITSSSSLQLNVRLLNNSVMEGDAFGFSEMEGRLQFRQRF